MKTNAHVPYIFGPRFFIVAIIVCVLAAFFSPIVTNAVNTTAQNAVSELGIFERLTVNVKPKVHRVTELTDPRTYIDPRSYAATQ